MFSGYLISRIKETANFIKSNILVFLLSFIFIFMVIWMGNMISGVTSRDILDPLSIKIEGLDKESLLSVKVLSKLSRAGNTVNLAQVPGHQDEWNNPAKTFVQKIMIGFQKEQLEKMSIVSVVLGDKKFIYPKDKFLDEWKKLEINSEDLYLYDAKGKSDYIIYEGPAEIKSNPLNIPIARTIFSSINLNGSEKLIKQSMFGSIKLSFLALIMCIIVSMVLVCIKKTSNMQSDETKLNHRRFFLIYGMTLVLTIFLLFIFNILVLIFYKPDIAKILTEASKIYLISMLPAFLPKPVERVQFVFSILLSPFLLLTSYIFIKKFINKIAERNINRFYYIFSIVFPLAIFAITYAGLAVSDFLYVKNSISFNSAGKYLYSLLLFPLGVYFMLSCNLKKYEKYIKYFTYFFCGILIIITLLINIFPFSATTDFFHLNPIYYPISQVMVGKIMLVNLTGLYGLFPVFLKGVLHVIGSSVLSFTTVMGLLLASSYLFLFLFLKKVVKNKIILLIGFSTIIFYFLEKGTDIYPYFQYFPVRMLFPSLILLLVAYYASGKKKLLYYVIHLLAATSILWNLDSGLIVYFSWILTLLYGELYTQNKKIALVNAFKHIIVGLFALAICFVCFGLYTYFISGHLPDLSLVFQYQKMFLSGFFMIPMPFPHIWIVGGIVLLSGLFMAIRGWWDKEEKKSSNFIIFFLSVMGFGLFSYYEGRSHDMTFYSPLFSVIALLTIQSEVIYEYFITNRKSYGYGILFLMIFFFLFSSPINLIYNSGKYYSWVETRIVGILYRSETLVTKNVDFIKKHTVKGESVIILSQNFYDGIFYSESNTRSALDLPSSTDVFFKRELSYLVNFLKCNTDYKLFIYPRNNYFFYDNEVNKIIENKYKVVDKSMADMALLESNSSKNETCDINLINK